MTSRSTRRGFLRASAGVGAATAGLAATTGPAAAAGVDAWLSDVSNYDGVVDRTGQSDVTVEVGVSANGGNFGFGPAAVRVDPGTTVTWKWVNGTHDVAAEDGSFNSQMTGETGFTYTQTFDSTGVTRYYCTPHRAMGMKGAILVGDVAAGGRSSGGVDVGLLALALGGAAVVGAPLGLGAILEPDDGRAREYGRD